MERVYGVFVYDQAGLKYREADAVKLYRRRADAERHAERHFPEYVVRTLHIRTIATPSRARGDK